MLSPEIAGRVDRIVRCFRNGVFSEDDLAIRLGELVTADNLGAVQEHLPTDLFETLKLGISLDNRRAADLECLQPEESPFLTVRCSDEYDRRVAEALLQPSEFSRRGELSVLCLPFSGREWSVRLLGSGESGYSLLLGVAEAPIYGAKRADDEVDWSEAPLPADAALALCETWRKMLLRVRHPEQYVPICDGVSYHFAGHGRAVGWMAGRTQSPRPETTPGRLAALGHLLHRYAKQGGAASGELLGEIREATDWFRRLS